ncbi:MAG: ribonuclease III, partial [Deltaproteobacteria bacterium GWC2_42_11]
MKDNKSSELKVLIKGINYKFNDSDLLYNALVHRSYINEKKASGLKSNERMEFLGDSILSAVISHLIITRFPDMDEGELSKLRAKLVNEATLSFAAKKINLGKYIMLGRGEEITGGREKASILADAYEAVIAAIYLDGGFDSAFKFISNQFESLIDEFTESDASRDYKTELQEYIQDKYKITPGYSLLKESGPEHSKVFEVNVFIKDKAIGRGTG